MVTEVCGYPLWQPSRENPAGECGRPADSFIRLGETGGHLPLCSPHTAGYRDPRPLSEWVEP